jgi:hypothetical protein
LEPNENNVLWRVNSAGIPHPDDLDKFFEQKRVIQLAFNKTVEESTLEPKIRAMTPQESFQWGGTPLIPFFATGAASTELKAVQGSSNAGDSGSRLTDADREAGYIQVLLNDGLTYVRVRNEDGRWMIHSDDMQLAQDINNSAAKGMLLAGIIPGILKGVWSGAKSAYNAITQESSKAAEGILKGSVDGLTAAEKKVVGDLVSQGKTVEIIPKTTQAKTPDFFVDAVKTELKTLQNPNTGTGMKRIQEGFEQGAEKVIIDARESGLTSSQAQEMINRALGKYPGGQLPGRVEIWTGEGIITYIP